MKVLLTVVFLAASFSYTEEEIQIQYIANEGVRISNESTVIYIDALFEGEFEAFDYLPQDTLKQILTYPSNKSHDSYILASHLHGDHFNSYLTGEYLQSNKNALFISPQETIDKFSYEFINFDSISGQIQSVNIEKFQHKTLEFDQVIITVLNLAHFGESPWKEATNFAYIIEISGKKILHFGDASIDEINLNVLGLSEMNIDIAIMHIGQMASNDQKEIIDRLIAPKHIIAAHIPLSYYENAEEILSELGYENITVFNQRLKKITL